jgi:hypothetical protein
VQSVLSSGRTGLLIFLLGLGLALIIRLAGVLDGGRVGGWTIILATIVFVGACWVTVTSTRRWLRHYTPSLWGVATALAVLAIVGQGTEAGAAAAAVMLALLAAALTSQGVGAQDWVWWKPLGLVTVGIAVVVGAGLITFLGREYLAYNYRSNFGGPTRIAVVAGLTIVLARLVLPRRIALAEARWGPTPDSHIVRRVWVVVTTLGWLGAVAVFGTAGVIPLFTGEIDEARVAVTSSPYIGLFWPVMQLGMQGVVMALCFRAFGPGRRILGLMLVIVSALPLCLYGGRSMLFLPLAATGVYLAASGRLRHPGLLAAGAALLLGLGLVYVGIRGFRVEDYRLRLVAAVSSDLFPEMRTAAMVEERLPLRNHIGAQLLTTTAITFVPSAVLRVVGIDKQQLWRPVGREFLNLFANEMQKVPGLRTSLLGEVYLGFGMLGVVGAVFGLLTCARLIQRGRTMALPPATAYREAWLGVLLGSSVLYGNLFISTVVFVGVPATAVSWALSRGRTSGRSSAIDQPAEALREGERT